MSITDEGTADADDSATGAAAVGAGAIGLGVTGWPDKRRFLELTDVGVLCVCRLLNDSGGGWPGADMVETCAGALASGCCCDKADGGEGFNVRFEAGEDLRGEHQFGQLSMA